MVPDRNPAGLQQFLTTRKVPNRAPRVEVRPPLARAASDPLCVTAIPLSTFSYFWIDARFRHGQGCRKPS